MGEKRHVLKINKKYKKEFMEENQRKELKRKKNVLTQEADQMVDSDSESEDEDAELLTPAIDKNINSVLAMIRSNDPKIRNSDFNIDSLYLDGAPTSLSHEENKKGAKRKRDVKKTLTQVVSEQLLANQTQNEPSKNNEKTNVELKSEARKAFLDAVVNKEKDKKESLVFGKTKTNKKENEANTFFTESNDSKNLKSARDFGIASHSKQEDEQFLKDFFEKEYWRGTENNDSLEMFKTLGYNDNVENEEDESELLKQAEFEANYNFRFMDPEGNKIKSYSRDQNDSVRQKKTARAKRRESRKVKIAEDIERRRKEAARLKKVKEKEIREKLKQIETVAGVNSKFKTLDIEEDFDPEKFDVRMAQIFDKNFFDEEELVDSEAKTEDEKESGKEPKKNENKDKKSSKREIKKLERKKQKKLKKQFEEIETSLKSYSKVQYPETIGIPETAKFRYVKVKPKSYGLTEEEILMREDKELNKKISLKFLSTYRNDNEGERWFSKMEMQNGEKNDNSEFQKDGNDNRFVRSEKIVKKEMKRRGKERKRARKGKVKKLDP